MNIVKQESGFSLVELLVSVTIIGLLAASSLLGFQELKKRASDMVLTQAASDLMKASLASHIEFQDAFPTGSRFCNDADATFKKDGGTDTTSTTGDSGANAIQGLYNDPFVYYKPNKKFFSLVGFSSGNGPGIGNRLDVIIGNCQTKRMISVNRFVECNDSGRHNNLFAGFEYKTIQDIPSYFYDFVSCL